MNVINCSENTDPSWRWLDGRLPPHLNVSFQHVDTQPRNLVEARIQRPYVARYRAAAQAAHLASKRDADVLVTHLPRMTAWTELFCRVRGRRAVHLAFSFNFTELPEGRLLQVMRRTLPSVDRFVVFSSMERSLYAETFGLDPQRIDMIHWGVRPPEVPEDEPPMIDGEYVCAVGGEGRDYGILMEAMRRLPHLRAVVVARPHNLHGLDVPPNVTVKTNIPFAQANNIVRYSRFMILPLLHAQVPCGHVTLVNAMYFARALVISNSVGIADYVQEGETGLAVPAGDADALTDRIQSLWDDPALAERMGANGRAFAERHCTEQSTIDYFSRCLQELGASSRAAA